MSTERGNLAKNAAEFRAGKGRIAADARVSAAEARAAAAAEVKAKNEKIAEKMILKMNKNRNKGPLAGASDAEIGSAVDVLGVSPIKEATEAEIEAAVSLAGETSAGEAVKRFETGQSPVESYSAAAKEAASAENALDIQAAVRKFEEQEETKRVKGRIKGMN